VLVRDHRRIQTLELLLACYRIFHHANPSHFDLSILLALLFAQTVLASDLVLVGAKVYLSPTDPPIGPLPMQLPIVQAAADEAHRKGKLVFAHPSTIEGVELVLQGHVDVLAHTTEDPDQWNAALVKRLKSANVSLIPTLTLFSGENGPDAAHEGILREVKSYSDAGGKILFGTDVGYEDYSLLATGKGVNRSFRLGPQRHEEHPPGELRRSTTTMASLVGCLFFKLEICSGSGKRPRFMLESWHVLRVASKLFTRSSSRACRSSLVAQKPGPAF